MKCVCDSIRCAWRGDSSEILRAPNPFEPGELLEACPECRQVGTPSLACDEPECWNESTCGMPTGNGYRALCSKRYAALAAKGE